MFGSFKVAIALVAIVTSSVVLSGCSSTTVPVGSAGTATPSDSAELAEIKAKEAQEKKNLEVFDDLDFNVYSGQHWDQFTRSHSQGILVHYPDGHTTTGLEPHLVELKPQFVFAPDTRSRSASITTTPRASPASGRRSRSRAPRESPRAPSTC